LVADGGIGDPAHSNQYFCLRIEKPKASLAGE